MFGNWLRKSKPVKSAEETWQLANEAMSRNGYREAIDLFSDLLRANPGAYNALINRAVCYKRLEEFALEERDRLAAFDHGKERTPELLGDLAICQYNLKKTEAAAIALDEPLELKPGWDALRDVGKKNLQPALNGSRSNA